MSADVEKRKSLSKQIFDQMMSFDADSNGFIDATEFKAYLKAVGQWGTDELYSEDHWADSWPTVRPACPPVCLLLLLRLFSSFFVDHG